MQFLELILYTTDIEGTEKQVEFEVSQNYPNPARNTTYFSVRLEKPALVSIGITDVSGKSLKGTEKINMDGGLNYYTLDVSDLRSGIYYYTVSANEQKITRKLIVH